MLKDKIEKKKPKKRPTTTRVHLQIILHDDHHLDYPTSILLVFLVIINMTLSIQKHSFLFHCHTHPFFFYQSVLITIYLAIVITIY
jgi:hypothetical protein